MARMDFVVDIPEIVDGNAKKESTEHHPQSCDNEEGHGGVCACQELSGPEDAYEEDQDG